MSPPKRITYIEEMIKHYEDCYQTSLSLSNKSGVPTGSQMVFSNEALHYQGFVKVLKDIQGMGSSKTYTTELDFMISVDYQVPGKKDKIHHMYFTSYGNMMEYFNDSNNDMARESNMVMHKISPDKNAYLPIEDQ